MSKVAKLVGLDVHKSSICLAVCEGGPLRRPRDLGTIPHDLPSLLRRLHGSVSSGSGGRPGLSDEATLDRGR